MTNIVAPIILVPILVSMLGMEKYGSLIFLQTIISYVLLLVTFGFNISAVRCYSQIKENDRKREYYSSVLIARCVLYTISMSVAIFITYALMGLDNAIVLFLLSYVCIQEIFLPLWLYQVEDNVKIAAYTNLIAKISIIILSVILLRDDNAYFIYPLISFIVTLLSVFYIQVNLKQSGVYFTKISFNSIKECLVESWPLFLANCTQLYTRLNKIVLGVFAGSNAVAIFDIGEKIFLLMKFPFGIISQALFPRLSKSYDSKILTKITIILFLVAFVFCVVAMIFGGYLVHFISGGESTESVYVIKILSISLFAIVINNCFGVQYIIVKGKITIYRNVIFAGGMFYVFALLYLVSLNNISPISVSLLIVAAEFFTAVIFTIYIFKRWKCKYEA
ncbi:oligosaccharide flippase family protein [Photobacterium nomapromontoriensis]